MVQAQSLNKAKNYKLFQDTQLIHIPESSHEQDKNKERNYLRMVSQQYEAEQLAMRFCEFIDTWDNPVRRVLNQLAHMRWPSRYFLKFIPVSTYRLRDRQLAAQVQVWWVEHDIPPYDQYQCAAYRIYLTLNSQKNEPVLFMQSGSKVYPVTPLTEKNLKAIVTQVGRNDPPLVIARNMGKMNY